jgi:hypothetical protein
LKLRFNLSSKPASLFFFSLATCIVVSAASAGHPAPSPHKPAFDAALAEYKAGQRTAAYGHFARLADAGDAESARIALILLRHGPEMAGTAWGASQPQIDRWMQLARQPMEPMVAESGD